MAYEVTATRRRPQRFEDLVGQEFVAETLRNSIQSQKIAHAYLFSGPRGCGKTSTARILAKALNCANGPTATPCGQCQQCLEITKGACTDVIEIDGASNTSVNDVRQIKDEVLFPPQSCRYKIYIIDEVHMLSTSAFNALLKTIEEPPAYVIFIFATTELQKVPATIKSRCQQFNFRLVPIEKVKTLLGEAAAEINIKAEDEALYWIARESTGSIRDAYTLFDQVAAFSGGEITYDKIRDKLGLVGVDRLNAIFESCATNKTTDALNQLDDFLQSGISIEQLISNSTDYLRSLLLIKNGITKEALLGQSQDRYSKTVLEAWSPVQIERGISLFLQLYRDIRYSLSPRYELELAFSRLSWLSQYVSPAEVKAAIDKAQALLAGAPQPTASHGGANASGAQRQSSVANTHFGNAQTQPTSAQTGTPQPAFAQHVQPSQPVQPSHDATQNAEPQKSGGSHGSAIPNGLPVFSALQNAPQSDDGYNNFAPDTASPDSYPVEQAVPPEVPDPFDEGGAVPPEQTASVPYQTAAAAGTINDMAELKDRLVSELKVQDTMLATSLMGTSQWTLNGDTVTATVDSAFLKQHLESQRSQISEHLTRLSGKTLRFAVQLLVQQRRSPMQVATKEVKIVCDAFRGTIVNVVKKEDAQSTSTPSTLADETDTPAETIDSEITEETENDESL
ncbi:MAG: DNA polymerase III subunit gamma/tau [Treponema sp.]|nr:DNA polymerase III subunit gamma/tau [Treponema sp.]